MKKALFAIGYVLLLAILAPSSSYYETEDCFMTVISSNKNISSTISKETGDSLARILFYPGILLENASAA